ncbi:MAG: hypothetical protein ACRDN9_20190 [Streptosporangiaceae bacterium]
MSQKLQPYRNDEVGFSLPIPADWEVTEGVSGCAVVAVAPGEDLRHFRPNVVVTVERLPDGESLDAWTRRSREALGENLNQLQFFDTEETQIDSVPARRTLSHYLHRFHGGVNLEQWSAAKGGWGYVVSCSTAATDYDDLADVMVSIADGLRVEGVPA